MNQDPNVALGHNPAILRFQDYCEVYAPGNAWDHPAVKEFAQMVDSNLFNNSQLRYFCRKKKIEGAVFGLLRKYKRYNRSYQGGDGHGEEVSTEEGEAGESHQGRQGQAGEEGPGVPGVQDGR